MSIRDRCIQAGADAIENLPYDTVELRYWGKASVADPAFILSEAAFDAILDVLQENDVEWRDSAGWYTARRQMIADLVLVLRPDSAIVAALRSDHGDPK